MKNRTFNVYAHTDENLRLMENFKDFDSAFDYSKRLAGLVIITSLDEDGIETGVVYSKLH